MVFVGGGTGYIGRRLIAALLARRHSVRALARAGSERSLPQGCEVSEGNALDAASVTAALGAGCDTFVHLVGVAHPAPWKARQFREVDLAALRASATAASQAAIRHFVFVSVAHPAPTMKAYIAVRVECEEILRTTDLPRTILRPWYVLGPGHRWPYALMPVYRLLETLPATRETALRLGLVTVDQMVNALAWAVENPAADCRVLDVPAIRIMR